MSVGIVYGFEQVRVNEGHTVHLHLAAERLLQIVAGADAGEGIGLRTVIRGGLRVFQQQALIAAIQPAAVIYFGDQLQHTGLAVELHILRGDMENIRFRKFQPAQPGLELHGLGGNAVFTDLVPAPDRGAGAAGGETAILIEPQDTVIGGVHQPDDIENILQLTQRGAHDIEGVALRPQ